MMEFSRTVLAACASVLGLLFYVIAGLLIILSILNAARAEGPAAPATVGAAFAFTLLGWASRWCARRIV
jgi:hypothetical protein